MRVSAVVKNSPAGHFATVESAGARQDLPIAAKPAGRGSSVSGGEFLMLALATCYCNDIFREASALGIEVKEVEVEASGEFEAAGQAASSIEYRAKVEANASEAAVEELIQRTDSVAEVHLTVRRGLDVRLAD